MTPEPAGGLTWDKEDMVICLPFWPLLCSWPGSLPFPPRPLRPPHVLWSPCRFCPKHPQNEVRRKNGVQCGSSWLIWAARGKFFSIPKDTRPRNEIGRCPKLEVQRRLGSPKPTPGLNHLPLVSPLVSSSSPLKRCLNLLLVRQVGNVGMNLQLPS